MTPGDNRDFVRRSNEELYNHNNVRVLDDDFALSDPEAYKRTLREYFAAFPDSQMTVEALVAEGDAVGCHRSFRGTHLGEWMGIPATGKRFRSREWRSTASSMASELTTRAWGIS